MKNTLRIIVVLLAPALASAQEITSFKSLVGEFVSFLKLLLPLLFSALILVFFWGLAKFIANAGNEKTHEEGRNLMFWGTIGIFVVATLWGIVEFFLGELGLGGLGMPFLPT